MDATVYTALVPALQSDTCHEVDCAKFSVCWDPSAYEHGSRIKTSQRNQEIANTVHLLLHRYT